MYLESLAESVLEISFTPKEGFFKPRLEVFTNRKYDLLSIKIMFWLVSPGSKSKFEIISICVHSFQCTRMITLVGTL